MRMVEGNGVECFEVRIQQWFDTDGVAWTSAEVTVPEGHSLPQTHEVWGSMMMSLGLVEDYLEENR